MCSALIRAAKQRRMRQQRRLNGAPPRMRGFKPAPAWAWPRCSSGKHCCCHPPLLQVVREASKRVLGLRPFDVQLIGGMILHEGQVSMWLWGLHACNQLLW